MSEENFKTAMDDARWRYTTHGLSASTRAYEYGLLVAKNAFLVAGGGLFFIPAMVGLSADVEIAAAYDAGLFFAGAVLLALVGNYLIHINWMLHELAWDQIYEIERINIRSSHKREFLDDPSDLLKLKASNTRVNKWMGWTFWLPHLIVLLFLICLIAGATNLYSAFNIIPSGVS
ncbi:hypothetical protein [Loktanella sp. Alg231-35]|uniref:hypothetical protein n=1 Tax=Loktanella sp. Alg231-35 TaxID=1922220 RepID=UPI000D5576D7|nr:hypothetical protein [Loktanella sp. Alg231-35]